MQAMQSGTASGPESYSGKFAALRHVTRQMGLGGSAMPTVRRTVDAPAAEVAAIAGVAEGAGLAHDAGNLLGALSLYSDLLALPGVLHEEHKEYANELRMLSDRSWAMIDRLVNHARAGRSTKVQGEFAVLPDVVDRCRGLLSRVAGRTVEISYGVGAFQAVKVPVESVERILTNLVKNAAEATPWVGAISIHVEGVLQQTESEGEEPRRRVVMTVTDRGCGMDQAAVRRLMQTGGISSANGRGLGFRVVRELVAISGGSLNIASQPEVGTSISVEWSAMKRLDAVVEREELEMEGTRTNDSGVKMVVRGEAGWIAC
ncbi:sensor histidine kinase [Tunturiibacter gelidoferens]|uniref:Signal transduction histidine kinase n=1 Tax=Tunturiibacter gelidiferens TaxID=3069689 RepID=A0ACC5NYS5_9BACT|nr:HAMP domain-containing sensor histidine kinase [Edaphobacter lichenicola]MBB5339743.1 signal transduction histidine kinase [Edaphobacter lichenicola]